VRLRVWIGGTALALGAAYAAFAWWQGPKVEASRVVRRDIVQSVVAAGRVARPHRVDIGAQVVGSVAEVPVSEGQSVSAGQTLIVLDAMESAALVRQAETAVVLAEARVLRRGGITYGEVWLRAEGADEPAAHVTTTWAAARPARR